jgi:hypothetical protein
VPFPCSDNKFYKDWRSSERPLASAALVTMPCGLVMHFDQFYIDIVEQ